MDWNLTFETALSFAGKWALLVALAGAALSLLNRFLPIFAAYDRLWDAALPGARYLGNALLARLKGGGHAD